MIGDKGRETSQFSAAEDFETPVFYSGRAVLASDLNEANDRQVAAREKALIDVIGHLGFPRKAPGFHPTRVGNDVRIGAGRMYVDGARFEQRVVESFSLDDLGGTQIEGSALLVACCDKTERDYLDFPFIRDDGLGGPDTAGRRNGFVDLHLIPLTDILPNNGGTETALRTRIEDGQLLNVAPRDGRARFRLKAAQPATEDHCLIAPEGGFNRQGNFNYLVQIHTAGPTGNATFKWARDDVRALVEQVATTGGNSWVLREEPTDDQRSFATGNTIEIRGAAERAANKPGVLGRITSLDPGTRQIELTADATQALSDMAAPLTITRWDQPWSVALKDGIETTAGIAELENNIAVNFTGDHLAGDFWYCAARIRTGDILWPPRRHDVANGLVPPFNWGPRCVGLAMVDVSEGTLVSVEDLRTTFPDLNHIEARDVTISGIPPCGLTTGMTVQEALARICAMTRDPCCLTVRPDEVDSGLLGMREDLAELPTLSEALKIWQEVLSSLKIDPAEPYNRRMAIKFTQGRYKWDFDALPVLENLHSLSLTTCTGAPVVLELPEWLAADRCLNFHVSGLTVECSSTNSGLRATGGKSIEIRNCHFRRRYLEESPILKLASKRKINLADVRVHLDAVRGIGGFRPAIQVLNARAQTHFDQVQTNGSVIVGPVTPTSKTEDPAAPLTDALDNGLSSPFDPVQEPEEEVGPEQSAPTFRMTGCKVWKFLPDALMMNEISAWASESDPPRNDFTLNVADYRYRNIETARFGLRDFVLIDPGGDVRKLDWDDIVSNNFELKVSFDSVAARDKVPFRVLDFTDTEFKRGTSLFVGQTVTLRNCRFTQYGDTYHLPQDLRNVGKSLPFAAQEVEHLVHKPGNRETRPWYPVGMTICNWSGLQGNMGFPSQGHPLPRRPVKDSEKNGLPLLVDFGRRNEGLSVELALAGSALEAVRMRLVTLHSVDIRGVSNGSKD